jgi:hypothetical protein
MSDVSTESAERIERSPYLRYAQRTETVLMGNPRIGQDAKDDDVNPSTRIVRLVMEAGARLFHTPNHEAFATICVKQHWETWRIRDANFKRWIGALYYNKERTTLSDIHIGAALNVLEGQAVYEGRKKTAHVRVAEHEGRIYIDLANQDWETVEITSSGWNVLSEFPLVKFRRTAGMLPLPTPVRGGTVADLRPFVNVVREEHFLLILGWLVAALRPTGPYPLLVLEGNHGSSKSTASRLLRSFIDPNTTPLRSTPKNERDLMIGAENGWCQVFDNISEVPPWLSDCLCRLSTGGGFSTRRNYTDDDERLFNAMRPVMLNGISVGLERADSLDRALVIPLDKIKDENRLTEMQYLARLETMRPQILGALFDAVSCALRRFPEITIAKPPRMADFAYWVVAAEPALGCADGAFLRAYETNRLDANELALDSSLLAPLVKAIAENGDWSGTASALLHKMQDEHGFDSRQGYPKTPAVLSAQLRRLMPNLESVGISIRFEKTAGVNSQKIIAISKIAQP